MEFIWKSFWSKVIRNKDKKVLNDNTIFHYAVLEYLGYRPNEKLSDSDFKWVKNVEKGTQGYYELRRFVEKRDADYKNFDLVRGEKCR